jgi:hypothetical protein
MCSGGRCLGKQISEPEYSWACFFPWHNSGAPLQARLRLAMLAAIRARRADQPMALPNPERQKSARQTLADLLNAPAGVHAIHYACRSFHDAEQVATPRVTAIALHALDTGQTVAFSIQQEAETLGLGPDQVGENLDLLEKGLLQRFYSFVRHNRRSRYLHWNMRDARYGFAALEQRMRVLGGVPIAIPDDYRFDLARHMELIYGADYVQQRARLQALCALNGLAAAAALDGAAEARAFDEGRYRDVTGSALIKARMIAELAVRANDRTLKTDASLLARYAGPPRLVWRAIADNPIPSLLATAAGAFMVFVKVYDWLFGT